jgi:branched-chain amino acid transport system substrate-binding protein
MELNPRPLATCAPLSYRTSTSPEDSMNLALRSSLVVVSALALADGLPARAAESVKIGGALSLTGPAAVYGGSQKSCIQAAVDELNKGGALKGVTLQAVVEDDASTKEQGIALFQRFIHRDRVSAIIGPTLSNTATAADPLAQAAKVPVVAVSNTAPKGITDIGDYIWRVSLTEAQVIPGALKRLQAKLGFKKAGVLYGNDDAFTQAGYNVMKAALDAQGIAILGTQTFAKPDRDYNAQLTALRALGPDVLMVSALAENAAGIVAQARQLGWNVAIMGGNGFNSPAFIKNAGPAAEGVYVGTAWNKISADPANQRFVEVMKARGVDPDQFCAQAYTGVLVIAEAVRQSGMKSGRDDIKAGFAKVKDLPTPLGKFSFLGNRDGSHEPSVQVVKGGQFQIVQ